MDWFLYANDLRHERVKQAKIAADLLKLYDLLMDGHQTLKGKYCPNQTLSLSPNRCEILVHS